jgi:hypothetical protein
VFAIFAGIGGLVAAYGWIAYAPPAACSSIFGAGQSQCSTDSFVHNVGAVAFVVCVIVVIVDVMLSVRHTPAAPTPVAPPCMRCGQPAAAHWSDGQALHCPPMS